MSKKLTGLPIMYIDRLNYTEVALDLQELFVRYFADSNLNAQDGDLEIPDLAYYLEFHLYNEGLDEFLTTDFGKGCILGMYLEHKRELSRQDEVKVLEEMEGG